jgi:hypothetical protein
MTVMINREAVMRYMVSAGLCKYAALGGKAGLTRAVISRIMRVGKCRLDTAASLAKALGVEVTDIAAPPAIKATKRRR